MSPEKKKNLKTYAKQGSVAITLIANVLFGYQNKTNSNAILATNDTIIDKLARIETRQSDMKDDISEAKIARAAIWQKINENRELCIKNNKP